MAKFKRLVESLQRQIQQGIWQAGEKLPSLREQAESSGMSLMTVMHAYQVLEARGAIVSRPRSGYYVAPPPGKAAAGASAGYQKVENVSVSRFIFDVLQASRRPELVTFGSAFPDATLLPQKKLVRSLENVARRMTPASASDNLPPGNERLRQLIAQRYARQGIAVSPAEIVITHGAMEALNLSLQAVTQPGDWVVVENPAFYGALQAIERLGLKALAVDTHPQHGLDLDALEDVLRAYPVKACWLMSHAQNPAGTTLSNAQKQRLIALAERYQVHLIEDDVYGELYAGSRRPAPLKTWDRHNQVLHCSSFSKNLAAGLRIGWVAAGPLAENIQLLQMMSTLSVSAPIQMALADYLASSRYDSHLRKLRKTLELRKRETLNALRRHFPADVTLYAPPGGYFIWAQLPPDHDATRLYHLALNAGVDIAPGAMFSTGEKYRNAFRINASYLWDERREAAAALLTRAIDTLFVDKK